MGLIKDPLLITPAGWPHAALVNISACLPTLQTLKQGRAYMHLVYANLSLNAHS